MKKRVGIDLYVNSRSALSGTSAVKRGLTEVERQAVATNDRLDALGRVASSVGLAVGAVISVNTVRSALLLADGYNALDQRLKSATKSQDEYNKVSDGLLDISQRNGAALESNIALYQNLARSAQALGATSDQVLQVTDAVNALGRIGGASTEEMSSGIRQFSQALSGTVVRAEEANSVIEQLPELAVRIEKGLGLLPGQFKTVVNAGQVLSRDVFRVLLEQSGQIVDEAAKLPLTLQQSGEAAENGLAKALSAVDKQLGATSGISSTLQAAGKSFVDFSRDGERVAEVVDTVTTAGEALAIVFAGRLIGSTVASAQALVAQTVATREARREALAAAQTELLRAQSNERLALARLEVARGDGRAAAAAARAKLATVAATQAVDQATAAMARETVAARALSGALNIFGGLPGVLATVGISLLTLSSNAEAAVSRTLDLQGRLADLRGEGEKFRLTTQLDSDQSKLDELAEKLDRLKRQVNSTREAAERPLTGRAGVLTAGADAMNLDTLQRELVETQNEFDTLNAVILETGNKLVALNNTKPSIAIDPPTPGATGAGIKLETEIQKRIDKLKEEGATLRMTGEQLRSYATEQLIADEAKKLGQEPTAQALAAHQAEAEALRHVTEALNARTDAERVWQEQRERSASQERTVLGAVGRASEAVDEADKLARTEAARQNAFERQREQTVLQLDQDWQLHDAHQRRLDELTREGYDLQAEAEQEAYEKRLQTLQSRQELELLSVEGNQEAERNLRLAHAAELEADERAHKQRLLDIGYAAAASEREIEVRKAQEQQAAKEQLWADLESLTNSKSRKMFEVGKAASIAHAILNTYESATKSYNALAGIPIIGPALGAAAAAAAIAAGLANVQKIKSTQFQGGGGGGGASVASVSAGTGSLSAGTAAQPEPPLTKPDPISQSATVGAGGGLSFSITIGSVDATSGIDADALGETLGSVVRETVIPVVKEYVENDGMLISPTSRQAMELRGA